MIFLYRLAHFISIIEGFCSFHSCNVSEIAGIGSLIYFYAAFCFCQQLFLKV